MADLAATTQRLAEEQTALLSERTRLGLSYSQASARLESTLQPQIQQGQTELMDLIAQRTAVAGASNLVNQISELRDRREALAASMKKKQPKKKTTSDVTTRNAEHFCRVVEELLRSWKYPALGRVVFDPKKCDLVISDRDRGSQGKGYRALAHAAFTIGLMRFCREVNLPHPGLVVLDSPLVTLREPDTEPGEEITMDMKDAFYASLTADTSGDQVVVLENDEPPDTLHSQINFVHFSKSLSVGRYGFFPQLAQVQSKPME